MAPVGGRIVQVVDEHGQERRVGREEQVRVLLTELDGTSYLDDPYAGAKMFRDGFFYPSDMAIRRTDGRIRILGRVEDVVNIQGQKVTIAPAEHAIQTFLGVEDVCLFSGLNSTGEDEILVALQCKF